MKRIFTLALAIMLTFSLAACGGKPDPAPSGGTSDPGTSQQQPSDTPDPGTEQQPSETPIENPSSDPEENPPVDGESGLDESNFEWRDCSLTENIPKPTVRVLTGSTLMPGGNKYLATIVEISDEQAAEYLMAVKDAGWTGEESIENGNISFQATYEDGTTLDLQYFGGMLNITLDAKQ